MPSTTTALDLTTDVASLTAAVCDIESVSLDERSLADAGEAALREPPSLIVEGPEGARPRRARDERAGIPVGDPRRRLLSVGIAGLVAPLSAARPPPLGRR